MADISAYFPYSSSDQSPTPSIENFAVFDDTFHGSDTSSKRRKRIHECGNCKDLDKMPESCISKSNQEAQQRSRQRLADVVNQYNGLLKDFNTATENAAEFGATASYLLLILATMTHFCGWRAEAGFCGIPANLSELVSDSRNVPLLDNPTNAASDDSEGGNPNGFICYNGRKAPCAKCEEKPKGQWCDTCKSLARNKSTADCRRNKKEEALRRDNLQSQLEGTQSLLEAQRRLCRCLINVIRDMAWCPRCTQCSTNGCAANSPIIATCPDNSTCSSTTSNYSWNTDPTHNVTDPFFDGRQRRETVAINGNLFAIETWSLYPPDAWATHCMLAAANFYKNLNSLQCRIAGAYGSVNRHPSMKAHVDKAMADYVVAMNAIFDKNCYEPFILLKQAGLQNELVSHSFHIVMALHRVYMTSKYFPANGDTRLVLASGCYAKLDGVEDYLRGCLLPAAAHAELARLIKRQWTNERSIATEMTVMGVGEMDIAVLVFVAIMEQAKRIFYRVEDYKLADVIRGYRNSLTSKWSCNNYVRLQVLHELIADVSALVHDCCDERARLWAKHPNLQWDDVWNGAFVERLLTSDNSSD